MNSQNHNDVELSVIHIVSSYTSKPLSELSRSTRLSWDLGIDSLDIIEVLMDIEDFFNLKTNHTIPNMKTLGDLVDYVKSSM